MCKGQAVSGTGIYAKLFSAIGTAYGNGDGSTTFNVPDFRGMFLRGTDSLAINDPDAATRTAVSGGNSGAKVGSREADAFKSHTHGVLSSVLNSPASGNPFNTANTAGTGYSVPTNSAGTSTETRPKNIYVNYIIKY